MAFDIGKLKDLFQLKGGNPKDQVIGIDIGTSAIKVVGLHMEEDVPTLDTYGELQLGPYAGKSLGSVVQVPEMRLTEALVDIMRESSLVGTTVAFSISNRASFMTTFFIDALTEAEIQERMPVEARKYVPIPIAEVTLDWFVLSVDTEKRQTKVLLVAVFNESFDESGRVLGGAGLTLSVSEPEPFSAVRASITAEDKSVALLDFGASATKLYIIQDGMVQDVHIFRLSGEEITKIFMAEAKVDFAGAEELKRTIGMVGKGTQDAAVAQVRKHVERGLREIGNRLVSEDAEGGTPITKVYVLGTAAFLPGLIPFAQDILQRPLQFANPFSKVAYPAFLEDTLLGAGPSFTVALGCALRGLSER